jgi:ATP-dependent Clp protease ATP-binding subunit ClpC
VWDKFTDEARMTMIRAHREAQDRHHDHVKTEHVLLGLIGQDGGAAAAIFKSLHVSLLRLRLEVDRDMHTNPHPGTTAAPLTDSAKGALEYAIEEVRGLGHDAVDTGHLLLGLVRDPDGRAGRILRSEGLSPDDVRQKLMEHNSRE